MTIGNNNNDNGIGRFAYRLQAWLEGLIGLGFIKSALGIPADESIFPTMVIRYQRVTAWLEDHPIHQQSTFNIVFNGLVQNKLPGDQGVQIDLEQLTNNPSQFLADALKLAFENPQLRETFEVIGSTIYDSSVVSITGNSPPRNSEAAERARAFIGFVTALGAAPQVLSAAAEIASVGQIDKLGDNIKNIYWNLGLGFLTWQTMAPILQASILEPLQRDVQAQWRGQRFTLNQTEDLFALGRINRDQVQSALAELGWRDEDIEHVIALAYQKLSRSDVIDLWHKNKFTDDEAAIRLRGLGYSPDDVQLILAKEIKDDVADDRAESVSVLSQAFAEGLISQDDFIEHMSRQGYTLNEIDLRIGLIRLKQETAAKKLSVGQLKAAWQNNVILDEEALFQLKALGYADSEVQTILDTWKAEIAPVFLQVNQSNVLEAYRFGILDRRVTLEKLVEIGYAQDAATTLVEITEAKYPEAFGGSPPRKQKLLTLGAITDLYAIGRVTDDDVLSWAGQVGYSEQDAESLLILIKSQTAGQARALSQATIESAYATGVFTRPAAVSALEQLGYTPDDAETEITVFEKKNAATFDPASVKAVKQPSITTLVKAYQAGFIDQTEFFNRAQEIGYNKEAAQIYLETSNVKTVKKTKDLTKAEITEAFRKNLFDYSTALSGLEELGYSTENADLLLRMEQKGITSTDIWTALLQGWIDPQSAFLALLGLGFSQAEIDTAIASLG